MATIKSNKKMILKSVEKKNGGSLVKFPGTY